jgi:hypothetical protein
MSKQIPKLTAADLKRFWSKVDKSGDCWEWTACTDKDGYGGFKLSGKQCKAHRVAYLIHYDVDPGDELVCHSCDNPGCVNPEHLFLGTPAENSKDMTMKGRSAKGGQCAMSELSEDDVKAILASDKSHTELAERYGVTDVAISCIKLGKVWTHIKGKRHTSELQYNNTSGVNGASFDKRVGMYRAQVQFKKKKYQLGLFDTVAEAEQALIAKRIELGITEEKK